MLPEEFSDKKYVRESYVMNWLLDHNPDSRPTAQELLDSGYVPPKIEDRQLDELLKHTLSQNNSTRYQRLVSALFTQNVTPVMDQIYDSDCHGKNGSTILKNATILGYVKTKLDSLFLKHGAVFIQTPPLMPRTRVYDNLSNVPTFMDRSGLLVSLSYDSRISFARYISRNNIGMMRRYYIGRILRDSRIPGAHPSQIWECSFDIVSNCSAGVLPEAEVIYCVYEIIQEFSGLRTRNFYLRLNHICLVKAMFVQQQYSEELQSKLFQILETVVSQQERESRLRETLSECGQPEHLVNKLIVYLSNESSLTKAKELLQSLRKSKGAVSNLAKHGLSCLETLVKHLGHFGVDIPVQICTSLVLNSSHYSGVVFQVVADNIRKKKRGGVDILAVGGQYDRLVETFSKYAEVSSLPSVVGVSIALEKIVASIGPEENETHFIGQNESRVLLCSVGTPYVYGMLEMLRELWSCGVSASLYSYDPQQDHTLEEVQDYAKDNGISHIVVLKESETDFVRVSNFSVFFCSYCKFKIF